MLTTFSSTFSYTHGPITSSSRIWTKQYQVGYYCSYYNHDALINAGVHDTSAANSTSSTNCRNLNVFRIKGSGFYSITTERTITHVYPYTGSLLLYVLKQSEGQTTSYSNETVDIKALPLYAHPADVVFCKHFFSKSRVSGIQSSNIAFDVRTNITLKPNQRLRCCMVCFYGQYSSVASGSFDLTTTVFYNGN